jgi:hypothetical protein
LDRRGEDFLALQQYVRDKATLLERLAQMEEKRDKIKKAIFEKIKSDYDGKLRKLIEDFRPIRIRVIQKLGDFEQELSQIEKKLTFAQDKVVEYRFRHQLGEYGEDEFRRLEYEHLAQVDQIQAAWDELNADLEDYRSLIGDDKDFQRRYAFEERPGTGPDELGGAEANGVRIGEESAAAAYDVGSDNAAMASASNTLAAQSVAGRDSEEVDERTESTHDTALMDDEELFGRYYKDQGSDSAEITELDALQGRYVDDDSGTMEMPADLTAAGSYSTEDSSTGVWPAEGVLPAVPAPAPPPAPASRSGEKVAGNFLHWREEEDDKDSTMVWGGGPVEEVQAAVGVPQNVLIYRDKKNNKDLTFTLGAKDVSIGRSQDNDIVLTEGKISRRHAKVHHSDEGFVLSDLNSSNGTFVNGKRITRPVILKENDEIAIGDSIMTFR